MIFYLALSFLCCGLALVQSSKQTTPVANSYDPGKCDKKKHGGEVLVKDRTDEEIILICVKDKGGYKWKPADGTKNTVGEFFKPGLNCSDILDKLEDAKDGFYWITLTHSSPIKVFCDMTTDGGGFMLIGRKKNSITWTVPSNNTTVEPHGEPHWSSSLGDALILDFRVQMAINDDFKTTKAHWSFRLQSKRALKNLMMNTAGCDQRSAGIGDIAYVKNLLTENIATTKLRCSKFGYGHSSFARFGWHKMNSCLQKPCAWGFAFHDIVKEQVDFSGGFSFSSTGRISGMEYNATAFVGCDNGHCCGCYGPVGGSKDYCAERCKAINGGTVTKSVFTWFWVRSSLPKRIWKKCMDYQVKRDDGKLVSYKLVGNSVIPVEGRCGKYSTLLHDGIVVAPDSSSAQKVPAVDGLLEYRKDKQELYIRYNKTWNVLAQENKVHQKIIQLENRIKKLNSLTKKLKTGLVLPQYKECFGYKWLTESHRNWKYLSTHDNCDRNLSGWYRFGGAAGIQILTSCKWGSRCGTAASGWMNGTHPTVAEGKVTRKVCYIQSYDRCCMWSNNIEVLNCGQYYVYKLGKTPGCYSAYCGSEN